MIISALLLSLLGHYLGQTTSGYLQSVLTGQRVSLGTTLNPYTVSGDEQVSAGLPEGNTSSCLLKVSACLFS